MQGSSGWAVVMSKPMAEEVAERAIREAGYRVYLPRSSKKLMGHPKRAGERGGEIVLRPAFRGYLFAELHPGQQWGRILDSRITRGVSDFIWRGDRPALLPHDAIDALRECENAGHFDEPRGLRCRGAGEGSKRRDDLAPGDSVRLTEGPFASFLAALEDQDDQGRADVLIKMMGRDVRMRVESRVLEAVAAE